MDRSNNRPSFVVGAILIAAGVFTLLGQFFSRGDFWPVIIIGFGLAFFAGMLLGGRSLSALAIPGSILTGMGLLLFAQNTFGMWETWSYAWALIISFVGIGMVIAGIWSRDSLLQRKGWRTAETGLVIFLIIGIISELIFSTIGVGRSGIVWPAILVLLGFGLLLLRSYRLIRGGEEYRQRDVNLFWPVIFIAAGVMWAMINQNTLTISQLSVLLNLWPVLLIAGGINIIVGRRFQWVNLLLGVAVAAGMFYVIQNGETLGLRPQMNWAVMGISIDNQPIDQWIQGSGELKTEEREVSDFESVTLRTVGSMEIVQGEKTALTIEAEENILPYLISEVRGNELTIQVKRGIGINPNREIHYRLTVKDLNEVNVVGAANVRVDSLTTDRLKIIINGVGQININDLQAESFYGEINGSGTVKASGTANESEIEISGAGGFDSPDLKTENTSVRISGLGRATVWATQSLNSRVDGAGSVSYYGSPNLTQSNSGIGSVHKVGDK